MTNKTLTYIDSETVWDKVADNLEVKGPFAVCYQDEEILALLHKNVAVMLAAVYEADGEYSLQVSKVLDRDLNCEDCEDIIVATLEEAGLFIANHFNAWMEQKNSEF